MEGQDKNESWCPWGDIFLREVSGGNRSFVKLPRGIYRVLDRMGFKMGRDRVVICLVRKLMTPGLYRVRFTHEDLADEAQVSRKTVYTVLQTMEDRGARLISSGTSNYNKTSEWDLMGFIARVVETEEELRAADKAFEQEYLR
jgi:HTH domain